MRSRLATAVVLAAILSLAGCSGTESNETEGASGTILADLPSTTTIATTPIAPAALVVQVDDDAPSSQVEGEAGDTTTSVTVAGTDTTVAAGAGSTSSQTTIGTATTTTSAPTTVQATTATTAGQSTTSMATTTTIQTTTVAPTTATTAAPTTTATAPPTTAAGGTETREEILRLALPKHGGGSFNPDSVAGKNVILWFWGAH